MTDLLPTAVVVIPARLGSTRFPEKVLVARTGRPLVQHVVDRVRACRCVTDVIVAADDRRVADALRPFGTTVVMTSPAHESGTDRVAEVMRSRDEEIVVNVQGDEPEVDPSIVDALVRRLSSNARRPALKGRALGDAPGAFEDRLRERFEMATVVAPFPDDLDVNDPNRVKAVVTADGRAVYFSRAPVPHHRDGPPTGGSAAYHLHLGLYAYRRDFLLRFAAWPPSPLERAEKLEQLRAVERGVPIAVVRVEHPAGGIDTPEQYEAFVRRRAAL